MPNIKITVKNKIALSAGSTEYICGNSDFVIDFDFDAEWDAYETKTARFIYGGSYQDMIFQGSQCAVPVISNTNTILCGVYAGDLHTTTPALIRARKGILCGNSAPADPAPDVYAQMMEILNKLSSDNPVDAVRYIPQELTEEQQKQARENISAPRAITAKYWSNGGVDDARMLYSMAIREEAKGPFLCYAEDEGFNRFKYKPPLQIYDCYSDTMAWGFTVRSADGQRYEAMFSGESEGFVLSDRIEECVTTVNGKIGEVKTLFEVKITKNADGTYSSDTKVWKIRNAVVAGFMCYATLDQERAMLSSFIEKYDAGTRKHYETAVFDLLPVISENAITQRKIVIDDVAKTVTVTETELPTTSAVEALKTEIGNNFLSYMGDQSLTMEQKVNAASNMGVRIPLQIILSGDGSEENPFDAAVLFEDEQVGGLEAFGEAVGGWLNGAYDMELLWAKGEMDILSLSPAHLCGDETGSGILFSNAQWQVTFTATQNEDGNTDWTVTAKETVSGEWKLHKEITVEEDVAGVEIELPSNWRRLCFQLVKPYSIGGNISDAAFSIQACSAATFQRYGGDTTSCYAYNINACSHAWVLVERPSDDYFFSMYSRGLQQGNSGFAVNASSAKVNRLELVDFGHAYLWSGTIYAGTVIKVMYVG